MSVSTRKGEPLFVPMELKPEYTPFSVCVKFKIQNPFLKKKNSLTLR